MTNTVVNGVSLEQLDWRVVQEEGQRFGLSRSAALRKIIREWAEAFRTGRAASMADDIATDRDKEER